MIIIMGYIHVDPVDVGEFTAEMRSFANSTRMESGCLSFTAALDDAAAGRFVVAERWDNDQALTAHLQGHHTAEFLSKWASKMNGAVLKYDGLNARQLTD